MQPPARLMSTSFTHRPHSGLRAELMDMRLVSRPLKWSNRRVFSVSEGHRGTTESRIRGYLEISLDVTRFVAAVISSPLVNGSPSTR